MSAEERSDPTAMLNENHAGRPDDKDRPIRAIYRDLRRIARGMMRGERRGHVLQASALVHEAVVRLLNGEASTEFSDENLLRRLYTSSVARAELYDWANGRDDPTPTLAAIRDLLTYEVNVIPFDADCVEDFGRMRVHLRRQGVSVDNMDLLIAATARVYDLALVTHNTRQFQGIPDLGLQDSL
jgi:tRNA(fMet)-specific endonuclease VapC